MNMTRDQVIDLMSLIVAHDGRNPSRSDLDIWAGHAERGRWSWYEAKEAVLSHFHHSTEWLMPGHVGAIITGRRQDEASRQMAEHRALENQPAADERVREIVNQLSESLGWVPKHSPVLSMRCPHCGAAEGYPCTRSGRPGHQDIATAAHAARREAADRVNGYLPQVGVKRGDSGAASE